MDDIFRQGNDLYLIQGIIRSLIDIQGLLIPLVVEGRISRRLDGGKLRGDDLAGDFFPDSGFGDNGQGSLAKSDGLDYAI